MDQTVAEEYKSSLSDLNFNSKPLINMLTMLADENKKHAPTIVKTILNHINSAPPEAKLPGLYLVDSIIKNIGAEYMKIFCLQIISLFTSVFEKVDENTRSLMFKLRQTWAEILPNKTLFNLDVSVRKLDPAWPVTAKNPATKKILINPKFIDGSSQEKKTSGVPADSSTSLKNEEDQAKLKQDEVLKQLLAKQEHLKQLEFQNRQLSIQKKNTVIGSNVPATSSFKKNLRDPRMVKINLSQNISPIKTCPIRVVQEKPIASKPELLANNPSISSVKNAASTSKAHMQTSSVSDVNIAEQYRKPPHQTVQPKKISPKKNEKNVINKNKQATFPIHKKKAEEFKCSITETISTNKIEKPVVKTDSPKKKNIPANNKISQLATNAPAVAMKKKISQMRIPKKTEKQKIPLKLNISNSGNNKIAVRNEKQEFMKTSTDSKKINLEIKNKNTKLNDIANKVKSVKTNDSEENITDLRMIANKDEDLRVKPMSLNEDSLNVRIPKRDILESGELPIDMDKIHPRKKIKSDDTENCNPENRSETPVLFGNEDQDLRHETFNDINSKDWSQYKANHPDEYSPSPVKQEFFGRYRPRKYQFSHKYYHPLEHDRYGSSRHYRGRYFPRRNFHRKYFPRGIRGRWFHNSPIASVMLDSQAILRQAEEKFHSGFISEAEYNDLRHELQKMAECAEYQYLKERENYFKQREEFERHVSVPEDQLKKQKPDDEPENVVLDTIRLQKSSDIPPPEKTFILDGEEKVLHFIDDKAIILMNNNEPHELTFKEEERKVYIDGMAEPLTLVFDGTSVEFELHGRRHSIRFGIPGRELYINNHPYEAQFGGPPILAMLDDGHVYKINLEGPAPQVIIGTKPQYELFTKHHDVSHTSKVQDINYEIPSSSKVEDSHIKYEIPKTSSKVEDSHMEYDEITTSSSSLKDIDMRVEPNSGTQQDILLNKDSPFYCKEEGEIKKVLKDVDWRQIAPSNNLKETEKNLPDVHSETVASSYETWINEDSISFQERKNSEVKNSVPKEPITYDWNMPMKQHTPAVHMEQQRPHPPEHLDLQREDIKMQVEETQHPLDHIQQRSTPHPFPPLQKHPPHHMHQHMPSPAQSFGQQGQSQQPLHSENVLSGPQKSSYNQENRYWQNDSYRKKHHSSYPEESNNYHLAQTSTSQHFEGESKYFDSHPPPSSYVPYGAQRPPFRGRHIRGRYLHPRHRPSAFNPQFVRPRQNAPLLDHPRPRYPLELQRPLLPPPLPPLPPPYLSTSVAPQTEEAPFRASAEIRNKKTSGLLPTPVINTATQRAEPGISEMPVDVNSLLQKLVAAGIINTKIYEESEPEAPEVAAADEKIDDKEMEIASEESESIELTLESLKINRPSVLSALHKGMQCATCGLRFKDLENESYRRHLDWHFRINRRERDFKKAISRPWYFEIEDWLSFEEFDDFEERTPNYFELQADDSQPEVVEAPAIISVPATSGDDEDCCPVCCEKFELFWLDEEELWFYRNAVRHENVTYHPACYEDFKKASEAEKTLKSSENTASDSTDIEQEIIDILNTVVDEVCKNDTVKDFPNQTDLPNMEDVQVPAVELHSEEEILEGKPGEEEIIGLISESDVEMDNESPKAESKMVVMQSGGITLKVKAESLQCQSPSNPSEKDTKLEEEKQIDEEIEFRPPTPDPNFEVQRPISKGRELSGLCCIM